MRQVTEEQQPAAPMPQSMGQPNESGIAVSFSEVDMAVAFWQEQMSRPEFQLARDATPADIRVFTAAMASLHDHVRLNLGRLRAWKKNLERGLKVAESQVKRELEEEISSVSGRREAVPFALSNYYEIMNCAEAWVSVYEAVERWMDHKQDLALNLITTMKLEASNRPL